MVWSPQAESCDGSCFTRKWIGCEELQMSEGGKECTYTTVHMRKCACIEEGVVIN